jgi:AraC-like DNA-binding protein
MSPERHGGVAVPVDMAAGQRFDRHQHPVHQLAWAPRGLLTMHVGEQSWVLPRSRALWIPAGIWHEVLADRGTTMMGLYFDPATCPITWPDPTVVATSGLVGGLLEHLAEAIDDDERRRAEAVVFDLLRPLPVATLEVPMPADARALIVAAALVDDPADGRSLAEWGRTVGASARTLARAFERDTGLGFERWRTRARMAAALSRLAGGSTVTRAAMDVGYASTSAFVAAFRRTTGATPGRYFAAPPPSGRRATIGV